MADDRCSVCGGLEFADTRVLWPSLIDAWELSPAEAALIDVQQGTHCRSCGANVRSMALARAIVRCGGGSGGLASWIASSAIGRVLEINHAGTLHPYLARLPGHQLVTYPAYDMMQLPIGDGYFDLVVHSDTLEHVSDPQRGLVECRRVLRDGGSLAFTVPVVAGRLTRSRRGLPASYHGQESTSDEGLLVHTEFGADVWTTVFEAGFSACELVPFRYPAGLAIIARR